MDILLRFAVYLCSFIKKPTNFVGVPQLLVFIFFESLTIGRIYVTTLSHIQGFNEWSDGHTLDFILSVGEGNGTPLQYSCLENPMGGRAW